MKGEVSPGTGTRTRDDKRILGAKSSAYGGRSGQYTINLPPFQSSCILKEIPGWEALLRKGQIKVRLSRDMYAN